MKKLVKKMLCKGTRFGSALEANPRPFQSARASKELWQLDEQKPLNAVAHQEATCVTP
jgi:hypothetical protein